MRRDAGGVSVEAMLMTLSMWLMARRSYGAAIHRDSRFIQMGYIGDSDGLERCVPRRSDERFRFLLRYEPAQLSNLVEIAESFDADGLVDPTDIDRRETARGNQFGNRPAGLRIVRRIKQHCALRRTVRSRDQ